MLSEPTWQRGWEHMLGCRNVKCEELGSEREKEWGKERESIARVCVWPGLWLSTRGLPVSTGRNGPALVRDSGLFLRTACFLDGGSLAGSYLHLFSLCLTLTVLASGPGGGSPKKGGAGGDPTPWPLCEKIQDREQVFRA